MSTPNPQGQITPSALEEQAGSTVAILQNLNTHPTLPDGVKIDKKHPLLNAESVSPSPIASPAHSNVSTQPTEDYSSLDLDSPSLLSPAGSIG